ncbi:BnaC06g03990D [Brassica napus]|uniref:BnaC06g03990D protein n=1 Tax=Brassica napus TaxID=3708 RepID=A0A078GIS9_BRANA|nr:BnaC06g03990D [Brassica napus]
MLPKTLSQVRTTISVCSKPDDKFMRSLSSLKYLETYSLTATNRFLFRFVCQPILRSLSGKKTAEQPERRK